MLPLRPGTLIEQGRLWTIALNDNQNLLGKCVLVLNRPCRAVTMLLPDEWVNLHRQIVRINAALDSLFDPEQYNYAFLMNLDPQVHLHIVPRYKSPRKWDGEAFRDDHFGGLFGTDRRMLSAQQYERLSRAIASRLPRDTSSAFDPIGEGKDPS